ncbi:MAG: YceI family protein [Alphaproteobacteria bacterium]|nr:YceI family protein [Alphaproteobacteria bacterium]
MRHLNRFSLLLATTLLASPAAFAGDKYDMDKAHTNVLFFIDHLGFSQTIGRFDDVNGTLMLDEKAPEKSVVDVTIKATSINTQSPELNEHLQKPDWLDTAKYPDIRFVTTSVKRTGDQTADVTGNLTLHGVTKPVVLKTTLNKADYFQMADAWVAGFNAETTIKRSDFGVSNGIPFVGDDMKIMISTEFHNKEKKRPFPEAKH